MKRMEEQLGLSDLSIISWVSADEECPLSRVPLYSQPDHLNKDMYTKTSVGAYKILCIIIHGLKHRRCMKNIISECIASPSVYRSTVTTLNLVHLPYLL